MSIRKRTLPSGQIRWLYDYVDQAGHRRAKQFKTKAAAVGYETKVRGELVAGVHVADSASVTVAEAADVWLAACETAGLEESTIRAYRNHCEKHIKPAIGSLKLSKLTAHAAQNFVKQLALQNKRPTVAKVTTSLKTLVSEAVRQGLASVNAVREVRIPGGSSRGEEPAEFPTPAEIKSLLANANGTLRTLIHVSVFSGMRPSETRGLEWQHVDLKEGVIRVRQRADRLNKIGRPKSKAGRRDIPIGPHVAALLREWKLAQPAAQRPHGLVFPDAAGNVEDHTTIYRRFGALQLVCGISTPRTSPDGAPVLDKDGKRELRQKYGLHAMRHACASMLIAEGWQPKRIQVFMGHASIAITYDVYGHLWQDAEADQKAVSKLEGLLLG